MAIFSANLIYAINYIVAKDVMPDYLNPSPFILLRAIGATSLFWFISLFTPKEKIEKKDYWRLILCALFGVTINQLSFFKGLSITSPINAAILMTCTPILVLITSAIIIKEKITRNKVLGIIMGMIGAIILIGFGSSLSFNSSSIIGDLFILINALSYGTYLVLVKPLMRKYTPLTVIRWVFSIGLLFVFPVSYNEAILTNWSAIPTVIWWEITYVIIGVTFFAYLLNIYALKNVSPSVVSTYLYVQPVLTAIIAILLQRDSLSITKILATILIISGVWFVSKQKAHS